MRDKERYPLYFESERVILEEISPKYFEYVIKWRNDTNFNKYLNQPYKLTMEMQDKWYREVYLKDDTQGYMIMIDKHDGAPFGTKGWTDMDYVKRQCVGGRLLLVDPNKAMESLECSFLLWDYLYHYVDVMYCHIAKENKKAIRFDKKLGFIENVGEIEYPNYLIINNIPHDEYYRTREQLKKIEDRYKHLF